MPVIDLMLQQDESDCQLTKFTIKADSRDEDHYVADLWLAFPLKSVQDADALGKLVPGAREVYERATNDQNNEKFTPTMTPACDGLSVVLSDAKHGEVVCRGGAEVLSIKMRASKRAVVAEFKLRMGGQEASSAARLTGLLRNAASLSTEFAQAPLPFPKTVPTPDVGSVVVVQDGEATICGRVKEVDGTVLMVHTFYGDEEVDAEDVQSFYGISADDLPKLLKSYRERCKRREIEPSWEAITHALCEEYSGSEATFSGKVHHVSATTIERAVELISSGEVDVPLPPEAGEAVGQA